MINYNKKIKKILGVSKIKEFNNNFFNKYNIQKISNPLKKYNCLKQASAGKIVDERFKKAGEMEDVLQKGKIINIPHYSKQIMNIKYKEIYDDKIINKDDINDNLNEAFINKLEKTFLDKDSNIIIESNMSHKDSNVILNIVERELRKDLKEKAKIGDLHKIDILNAENLYASFRDKYVYYMSDSDPFFILSLNEQIKIIQNEVKNKLRISDSGILDSSINFRSIM